MRHQLWVSVLALAATVPATGQPEEDIRRPVRGQAAPAAARTVPYVAPKADGAVVELLDEGVEPLFPRLVNDGVGDVGTITREDRDVFAGVEATRVTPMQRYTARIPGWNFKIVEKPKNAGEFRYLRFAWKKSGGEGIMIQFHDPARTWSFRFHAGRNVLGLSPAKQIAEKPPAQWELVTRDLFDEFGAMTITGFALSPFDGTDAVFDHVLLGRTVKDLDQATDAALGRVKRATPLTDEERETKWREMTGTDPSRAALALREFLATAPDQIGYIRDKLASVPPKGAEAARVRKLIAALGAEEFDTREQAMNELIEIGESAIEPVIAAQAANESPEVRFRCRVILKKLGTTFAFARVSESARLSRAIRVLERAGNGEARKVLTEIAQKKLAPELAADAKAALARMPKP